MKSIILMFIGGTLGGLLGPLGALIGALAGFFAGRYGNDEGAVLCAVDESEIWREGNPGADSMSGAISPGAPHRPL